MRPGAKGLNEVADGSINYLGESYPIKMKTFDTIKKIIIIKTFDAPL